MTKKLLYDKVLVPEQLCIQCMGVRKQVYTCLQCSHVANLWKQVEIPIRKNMDQRANL